MGVGRGPAEICAVGGGRVGFDVDGRGAGIDGIVLAHNPKYINHLKQEKDY